MKINVVLPDRRVISVTVDGKDTIRDLRYKIAAIEAARPEGKWTSPVTFRVEYRGMTMHDAATVDFYNVKPAGPPTAATVQNAVRLLARNQTMFTQEEADRDDQRKNAAVLDPHPLPASADDAGTLIAQPPRTRGLPPAPQSARATVGGTSGSAAGGSVVMPLAGGRSSSAGSQSARARALPPSLGIAPPGMMAITSRVHGASGAAASPPALLASTDSAVAGASTSGVTFSEHDLSRLARMGFSVDGMGTTSRPAAGSGTRAAVMAPAAIGAAASGVASPQQQHQQDPPTPASVRYATQLLDAAQQEEQRRFQALWSAAAAGHSGAPPPPMPMGLAATAAMAGAWAAASSPLPPAPPPAQPLPQVAQQQGRPPQAIASTGPTFGPTPAMAGALPPPMRVTDATTVPRIEPLGGAPVPNAMAQHVALAPPTACSGPGAAANEWTLHLAMQRIGELEASVSRYQHLLHQMLAMTGMLAPQSGAPAAHPPSQFYAAAAGGAQPLQTPSAVAPQQGGHFQPL